MELQETQDRQVQLICEHRISQLSAHAYYMERGIDCPKMKCVECGDCSWRYFCEDCTPSKVTVVAKFEVLCSLNGPDCVVHVNACVLCTTGSV